MFITVHTLNGIDSIEILINTDHVQYFKDYEVYERKFSQLVFMNGSYFNIQESIATIKNIMKNEGKYDKNRSPKKYL